MKTLIFLIFINVWIAEATNATALKIVSLSPNTTAIIHDLIEVANKGNLKTKTQLIGSIYYPGQPKYYHNYQNIGSFQALNIQEILRLKPDIVITWQGQTQPQVIELLARFGIKVLIFSASDLVDLGNAFAEIGTAIKLKNSGVQLQQKFIRALNELSKNNTLKRAGNKRPRVLLQLAQNPIFVAGGHGILNDIIKRCGGVNIFKNINKVSFEADLSAVLANNPKLIIILSHIPNWQKTTTSMWQRWQNLTAVKNGAIFQLSSEGISQFSPQIILGVKNICAILKSENSEFENE